MADPISFAVGNAVLAASGSFAAASAVSTAVFWSVTAAPFVISAVVADQQRNAIQDALGGVNDDQGLQNAVPTANPDWRLLLGRSMSAGSPFFSKGGEERRPYIWQGVVLADHQTHGLHSIYINDIEIKLAPNSREAISIPFYDGSISFIEVSFRNGTLDQQIDPILARDFPELEPTYRQLGKTTAVIKMHFGNGGSREKQEDKHRTLYGDGQVTPLYVVDGALAFDPRDANQSLAAESTWKFTRNASLNTMHALCWKFPFMRERIDWDFIAAAAEIDDEYVFSKSGVAYRRHTVDGVVEDSLAANDVISSLLTANGGRLVRNESKVYILPAAPRRPVGTLHKGNIVGGFSYQSQYPMDKLVNMVLPEFQSVERGYKQQPAPIISVDADVVADGMERPRNVPLNFTQFHPRAQRIATRIYKEGRQQKIIQTGVDETADNWRAGETINLSLPGIHSRFNGEWEILKLTLVDGLDGYGLVLRSYSKTVHDFDPATEEQDFEFVEDPIVN